MRANVRRAIAGRTIVLTGAANGIGAATARRLASAGARLVLLDVDQVQLAALATELGPAVAIARAIDVRDTKGLQQLALELVTQGVTLDVLVNNAAVYAQGPLLSMPLADFEWCLEVDLLGYLRCCRAFVPLMRAERRPQIVNVLSEFAVLPFPDKGAYCVAKAAARMLSACLRTELRPHGIVVTDFVPPAVDTGLVGKARTADPMALAREAAVVRAHAHPAATVAAALCAAIARPRRSVVVGLMPRAALAVMRWLPAVGERLAARAAQRLGLGPTPR